MEPSDRIPGCSRSTPFRPRTCSPTGSGPFACPEDNLKQRPVTAAMAVQCIEMMNLPPVTTATIRKWAERGKVRKYGLDQYGLMKYDLTDIVRLAAGKESAAA